MEFQKLTRVSVRPSDFPFSILFLTPLGLSPLLHLPTVVETPILTFSRLVPVLAHLAHDLPTPWGSIAVLGHS